MDSVTPVSAGKVAPFDTGYEGVIDNICALNWTALGRDDITKVAWAYYFFSVQFRENLQIAHCLYPNDRLLTLLVEGECDTDNLSPWPDVAKVGEKLNHDEFMRRLLQLCPIDLAAKRRLEVIGLDYLKRMRSQDDEARAKSISSFEDGGLERVFSAILTCQCWDTPLLQAFEHFLRKHIEFDSNPDEGHGALARHLRPDESIRPLWDGFYSLFVDSVPRLKER